MSEVEWTNESVIQLVEAYRRLPELWDRAHDLHAVHTAKYEAWTSLARLFHCDIADLRKKITSVLASYRREKGKIRNGARSSWFLYPRLKFLSGYIKSPHQSTITRAPAKDPRPEPVQQLYTVEAEEMDRDDADDDDDDDDGHEVTIKQEPAPEPSPLKRTGFASLKHNRRLTRLKRPLPAQREPAPSSSHTDTKLLEMLRLLKKSDISKKKDECDSFGEYIATSLRKHDDRTQSMIKQAINNILFEQEMKKYSSYSVLVSPDRNPLGNLAGDGLADSRDD